MLHLLSPPHSTPLKSLIFSPVPSPIRFLFRPNLTMSISSSSIPLSNDRLRPLRCYTVPGLSSEEAEMASDEAFRRYSSPNLKRTGKGVAIVWFRNDLRVLDNEALVRAWATSESVLPVYCVDPRNFGTTHYFGFPKTGGMEIDYDVLFIFF